MLSSPQVEDITVPDKNIDKHYLKINDAVNTLFCLAVSTILGYCASFTIYLVENYISAF